MPATCSSARLARHVAVLPVAAKLTKRLIALGRYQRSPTWMWANEEVADFTDLAPRPQPREWHERRALRGRRVLPVGGAPSDDRPISASTIPTRSRRSSTRRKTPRCLLRRAVLPDDGAGLARAGMVNVGQVVRERHGRDGVVVAGFGGHRGSIVAAEQ